MLAQQSGEVGAADVTTRRPVPIMPGVRSAFHPLLEKRQAQPFYACCLFVALAIAPSVSSADKFIFCCRISGVS